MSSRRSRPDLDPPGPPVIVLGIDPGTAMCGYGVVWREGSVLRMLDYGCIQTSSTLPPEERLLRIHESLDRLLATHRPTAMGVERLIRNSLWKGRSQERFYDAIEWLYGWNVNNCLAPEAA